MKITSKSDRQLLFEHRPQTTNTAIAIGTAGIVTAVLLNAESRPLLSSAAAALATIVGIGCLQALGATSRVRFDSRAGIVTWSHQRIFGRERTGSAPLSAIRGVELEEQVDVGSAHRIVLEREGAPPIPLTPAFVGVGPHRRVAAEIREWIRDSASDPSASRDSREKARNRTGERPPVLALLIALAVAEPLSADEPAPTRPNVLLVYTDDQGSIDVGCYGATDLHTPNLDALAANGVRFTQFYSAAPVCSPSRAALLTGRYPQRAGLASNASSRRGGHGMPSEQRTIAEILKNAGYATGHIGKWHLGYAPDEIPNAQGFDHSFGHMGGCIDNYSHFFYWNGPNRHDLWRQGEEVWRDGEFFPDLMVDEAADFLERHRSEPWFLYFALNTPHYPLQPTKKWREKYRDLASPRRDYAAFVSTTDEAIGRLLARIDALGMRERTIVIFQSDHGHSVETRAFSGGGNPGPYRGAKFSLFEGGIRVPAIVSWPGRLPTGEVRGAMGTSCDWLPTLLELCGAELPAGHRIDGKSLVPVIQEAGAPSPHETFHWQSGACENGPRWAVRSGPWKLLAHPFDPTASDSEREPGARFLVHVEDDPGERENLVARYPRIVARLERAHREWAEDLGR